jgi:dihydroorotate dehydrogenase (NAD+) catalytic subunit
MCLTTSVGMLHLDNPLILASGIADMTAGSMTRCRDAGAVVTKSVGREERPGYGNPSVVELEHGILNAMGLPNPGIDDYLAELYLADVDVLVGSVFGRTADEFVAVAEKMAPRVAALELNMSCPHAGDYGAGVPTDHIAGLVDVVKGVVEVPVWVKLGAENILERADAAVQGGADAIVAINTLKAMAINVDVARPILANKIGGLSGPVIRPVGIRCVYELAGMLDVPLVGVGGITTVRDVVEYMMAGAAAVQIGTGLHYGGMTLFEDICNNMQAWLEAHGYGHVRDVIGLAHTD